MNSSIDNLDSEPGREPDNSQLCQLLDQWGQKQDEQSYKAVLAEILNGRGFILLPSINEEKKSTRWFTTSKDSSLQLLSLFEANGIKVLGAFSDEAAMVNWAKKVTDYTAMPTRDLLEFCGVNNISRVVINNGEANMFVLQLQAGG